MRKSLAIGIFCAVAVATTPALSASWDGMILVVSSPYQCPFFQGGLWTAVYKSRSSTVPASFNFFSNRAAMHLKNNSPTSIFNDAGKYTGTILHADGRAVAIPLRSYRMTFEPSPAALPLNFTVTGSFNVDDNDCGNVSFRGSFTRQILPFDF